MLVFTRKHLVCFQMDHILTPRVLWKIMLGGRVLGGCLCDKLDGLYQLTIVTVM